MWDLPRPGLEPMSPALAGRFLTTEPPGKSQDTFNIMKTFMGQGKTYHNEVRVCFPSYLVKRPHTPATDGFAEANRNRLDGRGESVTALDHGWEQRRTH